MRMIVAKMDDAYEQAGVTLQQLGCSRAALDTMITECKDAKWLNVRKNKQGYRSLQATDIVVECWLGYADYVTRIATEGRRAHHPDAVGKVAGPLLSGIVNVNTKRGGTVTHDTRHGGREGTDLDWHLTDRATTRRLDPARLHAPERRLSPLL